MSPEPNVLNGYNAKWKQIRGALPLLTEHRHVYFLETIIIGSEIPIKCDSDGGLAHLAPLDSNFHVRLES